MIHGRHIWKSQNGNHRSSRFKKKNRRKRCNYERRNRKKNFLDYSKFSDWKGSQSNRQNSGKKKQTWPHPSEMSKPQGLKGNLNKLSGRDVVPKWKDNQARFRFSSALLDSIYSETTYTDIWKKGPQVKIPILSLFLFLLSLYMKVTTDIFRTNNGTENIQTYALSKEIAREVLQPNKS